MQAVASPACDLKQRILTLLPLAKALSEVCKAINDVAYSVEVKSLERRDPTLGGTDARH